MVNYAEYSRFIMRSVPADFHTNLLFEQINVNSANQWPVASAHGRGARESVCAGLINQLRCCRFEPRIACLETTDTAIIGDWWTGWRDTTP